MKKRPNSWDPVAEALLSGATIRVQDKAPNQITGKLSQQPGIHGKQRVNVRSTPDGVVVWLTKKEQR